MMTTKIIILLALTSLAVISSGGRLPADDHAVAAAASTDSYGTPPWAPPEWFYNMFPPEMAAFIRSQVAAMTAWLKQFPLRPPPFIGGGIPLPFPLPNPFQGQPKFPPVPQPQFPPVQGQPKCPPSAHPQPKSPPATQPKPVSPPAGKVPSPPAQPKPVSPPAGKVPSPPAQPKPASPPPAQPKPVSPPAGKVPSPPAAQKPPVNTCATSVTRVFDTCRSKNSYSKNDGYSWSCTYNDNCCKAAMMVSNECLNMDPLINTIKSICCPRY